MASSRVKKGAAPEDAAKAAPAEELAPAVETAPGADPVGSEGVCGEAVVKKKKKSAILFCLFQETSR